MSVMHYEGCGGDPPKGGTWTPARNRYFHGKLLDSGHLELEQTYFNEKRWLLNKLSLGTGTLCGLEVVVGKDRRSVQLRPGAAVDGLGREILVGRLSAPVDPTQPTDECGRPGGAPLTRGGQVTLYLCYHECPTEPAAVMRDVCGAEERCEHGVVEERYRVQVRAGLPKEDRGLLPPEVCARLFGQSPQASLRLLEHSRTALEAGDDAVFLETFNHLRARRGAEPVENPADADARRALLLDERAYWLAVRSRRDLLCRMWGLDCPTSADPCVPLAIVTVDREGQVEHIDNCGPRRVLYSNAELLELILCLSSRVDQCCDEPATMALEKQAGDNQVGIAGAPLPEALVVRVRRGGQPVANEDVVFEALGDSTVGADPAAQGPTFLGQTDANGLATLPVWTLGASAGGQAVLARIATGMPDQAIFKATARIEETLPVVRSVWPPNAAALGRASQPQWLAQFLKAPRIEVTFDRPMDPADLDAPVQWLGVFAATLIRNEVVVLRLPVYRLPLTPNPVLSVSGVTETYRFAEMFAGGGRIDERYSAALDDAAGRGAPGAAPLPLDPPREFYALSDSGRVFTPRPEGFLGALARPVPAVVRETRVITLIRARNDSIRASASPNRLLDADFGGAAISNSDRKILWSMDPGAHHSFAAGLWNSLLDTGATLPESGDGTEGGDFQAWFSLQLG